MIRCAGSISAPSGKMILACDGVSPTYPNSSVFLPSSTSRPLKMVSKGIGQMVHRLPLYQISAFVPLLACRPTPNGDAFVVAPNG